MSNHKEKISPKQFTNLVTLFTIGSSILFLPATLASMAKQDAWMSVILGFLIGLMFIFFYSKLAVLMGERTLIEACQYAFGKKAGSALASFYLFLPITVSTFLIWDIGDFMVTQIIVETPIQAIYIMFMIAIVYAVRLGIEPIVRSAEIFVPWVFSLFIIIFLFSVPAIEWENIQPVFAQGIRPIVQGSYHILTFPYLELSLFLMITKNVYDRKQITKAFFTGFARGTIVLFTVTIACILVLGPEFTSRNTFPVYVLGKKVAIGDFLQRIEVVIAIMWFLSIYFKLVLTFYCVVLGISQITGLKDYRYLTLPSGMLVIVLTIIFIPSSMFLVEFDKSAWGPLVFFTSVFIPTLVFFGIKYKNKKKQSQTKTNSSEQNMT